MIIEREYDMLKPARYNKCMYLDLPLLPLSCWVANYTPMSYV